MSDWYMRERAACKSSSRDADLRPTHPDQEPEIRYIKIAGKFFDLVTGEQIQLEDIPRAA